MAKTRHNRTACRILIRVGLSIYMAAVVLSAVIVLAYGIYRLFVRPPEVAQPGAESSSQHGGESQSTPLPSASGSELPEGGKSEITDDPQQLQRKELFYTFLLVGTDDGNGNADTLMVASYDVANQKVGVVSIPRDTMVDRSWSSYPKINGGYKKGVEMVRQEVSQMLGIPIDFYVKVDVQAFVALVDEVDGVDFDVPVNMDYDDPWQDLSIHFKKGMQHLDGQAALEVVRFRHNNDMSGYSDVGRTQTQQKLLAAVGKKVISWNSVPKVKALANIFFTYVDTDLELSELIYFGTQVLQMDLSSGLSTKTLTGRGDARYRGYTWCYELNQEQTLADINQLLNPYTTQVTADMAHIAKADG